MKKTVSIFLCCIFLVFALTSCQGKTENTPISESGEESTVQLVRLKIDVFKGEKLSDKHVELAEVPNFSVASELCSSLDDVIGKYADTDLYAGDLLYKAQVSDKFPKSVLLETLRQSIVKCPEDFVIVSDYIEPNTGKDVHANLQNLIERNPSRTIYFPDGEYVISAPLITKSEGTQSTTFFFSDNAVLKASDSWQSGKDRLPLISIGQKTADGEHLNDNTSNGSYFGVLGGVLDGNGIADGIDIVSSRETFIYGTCIKNTLTGIEIQDGANNGSSDSDIENVEIIGSGIKGSRGIEITGFDNTVSNVKIYDMETGIYANVGGTAYRSVSVFFSEDYKSYGTTIGIFQDDGIGFMYDCYVENACKAYVFNTSNSPTLDRLQARWTYKAERQTAFEFSGGFESYITQARVDFCGNSGMNYFLKATGGGGRFDLPIFDTTLENGGQYKHYLTSGGVIDLSKMK